jgi:hypothetical protein
VQDVPKHVLESEEFAGLSEQPDTILAAMVPHGEEVWVFRLDGPSQDVHSQREALESFVASLSFDGGGSTPDWKLPAGWEETPASTSSLREASIRVPVEGGSPLDLSVSRLPAREDWLHYQLRNYNRWRRQLQLPVAGAEEMTAASQSISLEDSAGTTASIIAISGKFSDGDSGPMATGGLSPTTAAAPAATGPRESELAYDAPEEWDAGPPGPSRRASFVVGGDGQQATIVVTAFPTGNSQMADPLANINRWRGQTGLPPLAADEVASTAESVPVGGLEGLFVALDGAGRAIRAAMVERGNQVWFFKLDGPQELVEGETERFRAFLKTVEFVDE